MHSARQPPAPKTSRSPIAVALSACRGAFVAVSLFSGMINVLMLTGSLFMLQVYDRVLPSRSIPTLIGLVALVALLYAFQGILEFVRGRILTRIGGSLDEELAEKIIAATIELPLRTRNTADGLQPVRDLDQLRGFLSGSGPGALFDLPWMPLYLGLCFVFHFWIGLTALTGAIMLIALTVLTEALARAPSKDAGQFGAQRLALAEAGRRNVEALQAMGMTRRLVTIWSAANTKHLSAQQRTFDVTGGIGAVSKVLRMFLQSGVLAVGAYLAIVGEATGGIIIASSILVSRALAPIELTIANWKGFLAARQSWRRLTALLGPLAARETPLQLPRPEAMLAVEGLSVAPPGSQRLVVQEVTLKLDKGQGLGIIGPTASGKTSLVRAMVGVWQPARGKIRLDHAALEQWTPEALGAHVGYLPQDVELFAGSVAQNICRFHEKPEPETILAAARSAGVHELILRLPEGYETRIGEAGMELSAGQRQRIALARALYGDPFLVVLDEPNSNLDTEGEDALTKAILGVRARGGIAVVIAHRPTALNAVDLVLAMANGRAVAFGPKDEVLRNVLAPRPAAAPLKAVEGAGARP
jgi:PrtD family type I secretion system ABC transporter